MVIWIGFAPVTKPSGPYGGARDLHNEVLRHVTDASHDDPARILRVARFSDFSVASETMELMRAMVAHGEADHLGGRARVANSGELIHAAQVQAVALRRDLVALSVFGNQRTQPHNWIFAMNLPHAGNTVT